MSQQFRRYLNETEERQLFACLKKLSADIYARRDAAWMQLLRSSGVRVKVLHALNVHHAREVLRTGRFDVPGALNKGAASYAKDYDMHASKKLLAAFRALLKVRRELGYAEDPDAALVMSRKGKRMSVRAYQQRMQLWRTLAGLPVDASPHWFRHTLAKRIMARSTSADPRAQVQIALNHASITSTTIYTRPDRDEMDEIMEAAG